MNEQTRAQILRWAAAQRRVQERILQEQLAATPRDRLEAVLIMWQASTLFPDYSVQRAEDEAAVRETWIRLKKAALERN